MSDLTVTPGAGHTLRMNDVGAGKNAQVVAALSAQGTVTEKGSGNVAQTAIALASLLPGGRHASSTYALVTVDGAGIRYWEDGTSPTATNGLYVGDGGSFEIVGGANIDGCTMFCPTGTARVNVQCKRFDQ